MNLFGSVLCHEGQASLENKRERPLETEQRLHSVEEILNAKLSQVQVIRRTHKSVCMMAAVGRRTFFVKSVTDPRCYAREMLFYGLFGALPFVPRMLANDDASSTMVLEYLSTPAKESVSLSWVFRAIGQIHGNWELIQREVRAPHARLLMAKRSYELTETCVLSDAEAEVLKLFQSRLSAQYLPGCIGDLQPAHVLTRGEQKCFVDFDAFSIGRPDAFDLVLALARFPVDLHRETARLLRSYETARSALGSSLHGLTEVSGSFEHLAAAVRRKVPGMWSREDSDPCLLA